MISISFFFAMLFLTFSRVCACWNYVTYVLLNLTYILEYSFLKNFFIYFVLFYNFPSECLSQHQYRNSSGPIHPKNQGELLYILGHSLGKNKAALYETQTTTCYAKFWSIWWPFSVFIQHLSWNCEEYWFMPICCLSISQKIFQSETV